ncbi:hypothetical protein [Sphingosinicella rhizophila]|uniref:Uncharacterized protein n=1 Tax=Sphingosinicella rhizophila TaxID=3050082 RepID=A0ABU3QBH2_9SPHN|nr:hypothetical protein [Sphingosinicella sp. GR2756]MDT9600742.1 hypothetical protein [Sphingosinicella sp. GR2756]
MNMVMAPDKENGFARPEARLGAGPSRSAGAWLGLAASPTFAKMAAVAALDAPPICAPHAGAAPLAGMTVMYLLMALFHLPLWLRLTSGRRQQCTSSTPRNQGE